jgi:hypothetical protein
LTNQPETDIAAGIINPLYQDQLETGVSQSPNIETLILGVRGSGLPPSPPNPSPPPSGGESSDKESSSSEDSQTSNNSQTSSQMANQNNHARPWLDQDVVAIPGPQHPLPKHPEKWLPKFDPDSK